MGVKKTMKQMRKEGDKKVKERNDRCVPMAKKILQIIIDGDPLMHDQSNFEKIAKCYTPISEKILQEMFEQDLLYTDVQYIWSLVLAAIEQTRNFVDESLSNSLDICFDILWEKDRKKVTMGDMDKVLRKRYNDKEEEKKNSTKKK